MVSHQGLECGVAEISRLEQPEGDRGEQGWSSCGKTFTTNLGGLNLILLVMDSYRRF